MKNVLYKKMCETEVKYDERFCSVRKIGEKNMNAKLNCQDAVYFDKKENIEVIALADGSGQSIWTGRGVGLMLKKVGQHVLNHFSKWYEEEDEVIRYQLTTMIRKILFRFCDQKGILFEEVQSTLVLAALDRTDGRAMFFHLGDGIIAGMKNGKRTILSYPENGLLQEQTYLTACVPFGKHLRILRGNIDKYDELLLLSDGWKRIQRSEEGLCAYERFIKGERMSDHPDDLGSVSVKIGEVSKWRM